MNLPNQQSLRVDRVLKDTWNFSRFFALPIAAYFVFFSFIFFINNLVTVGSVPPQILMPFNFLVNMIIHCGFVFYMSSLDKEGTSDKLLILRSVQRGIVRLPQYLLAYMMSALAVMLGLLLFILPGFYVWGRFLLYDFFVLLEKTSATDALKQSYRIAKPVTWTLATAIFLFFTLLFFTVALLTNITVNLPPMFIGYTFAGTIWILNALFTIFKYRYFLLLKATSDSGTSAR